MHRRHERRTDCAALAGTRIDRSRTVSFDFNGDTLSGFAGDTLASALLANGVQLVGRSFKLHRPRGFFPAASRSLRVWSTSGTVPTRTRQRARDVAGD